MTKKEEILKEAKAFADGQCEALIKPDDEYAFEQGAQWADRTMIAKACKWLDCYIDNYLFIDAENKAGIKWDDFINDFRKAMKGE